MKKIFVILYIVLITSKAFSQDIVKLQKSLDSLKVLKETYQQKMLEINNVYSKIERRIVQTRFDQSKGDPFYSVGSSGIYKNPDGTDLIVILNRGSMVKVLDQNSENYKVAYNDVTGWILKAALISKAEYTKKRNDAIAEFQKKRKADSLALVADKNYAAKRKAEILKKFGSTSGQKILAGKIWLGMTAEMARESWGAPYDINRSVGSFGVHEQWVYRNDVYLYFEDGILTSWQE
jgi:hypothetical protein